MPLGSTNVGRRITFASCVDLSPYATVKGADGNRTSTRARTAVPRISAVTAMEDGPRSTVTATVCRKGER